MDKIKYIRVQKADGTYTNNIPIAAAAQNVILANGTNAETAFATLQTAVGGPLKAALVANMIDPSKIYVYTGSETGYTSGHWYYYNGSTWTDGGVYNAQAINTDSTLTISGVAADAATVGNKLLDLNDALNKVNSTKIDQFVNILESYYTNRDNLTYVNGSQYTALRNYNGGNHIDCSTLVGLGLMGLSYEESPYNNVPRHVGNYDWAVDMTKYGIDFGGEIARWMVYTGRKLEWTPQPYDPNDESKTAEQIASSLIAAGVRKGDILFTANSDKPSAYMGITHLMVVRTNSLSVTYPLIESNGGSHSVWHQQLTSAQHIIMIARPITTNAAYSRYIEGMETMRDMFVPQTVGENLINYPYRTQINQGANTLEIKGVTFSLQEDGSLIADGTATGTAGYYFAGYNAQNLKLDPDKKYMLSGCPAGGSSATYYLYLAVYEDGVQQFNRSEFGEGLTFSTAGLTGNIYATVEAVITSGVTVNDIVYKPMLEEGDRIHLYQPTPLANKNLSVFYGLAKVAGDSTQSTSSNAVGVYTDEAKNKIQNMLNVSGNYELVVNTIIESEITSSNNAGKFILPRKTKQIFIYIDVKQSTALADLVVNLYNENSERISFKQLTAQISTSEKFTFVEAICLGDDLIMDVNTSNGSSIQRTWTNMASGIDHSGIKEIKINPYDTTANIPVGSVIKIYAR